MKVVFRDISTRTEQVLSIRDGSITRLLSQESPRSVSFTIEERQTNGVGKWRKCLIIRYFSNEGYTLEAQ